ncbi:MAG: radical SAM protein [Planctomycetes bacterium]|nr:radical SAM protein [Planctomycetota bacterium]
MTLAPPDRNHEANASFGLPARKVCVLHPSGVGSRAQPPHEALSLAAWARHQSQRAVRFLDADRSELGTEATCERLVLAAPDVIVICGQGSDWHPLRTILDAVASRLPECVRILALPGGRAQFEASDAPPVQFVLSGDAGPGLKGVLEQLDLGTRDFGHIPGLGWRTWQGEWHFTPAFHASSDLCAAPLPAWDLLEESEQNQRASLRTARICPPDCPTCHGAFGRTIRRRPVADVLAEARHLVERRGVKQITIVDEVFDFEPTRAKEILRGLIALHADLELRLPAGLRGDRIDSELARLLRHAGLRACHIAIGSATPRIQRELGSNLDLTALRRGIQALAHEGIRVHGRFGLGFELEDPNQRERTVQFALNSELFSASFEDHGSGHCGPLRTGWTTVRFYVHKGRLNAWRTWAKDRYTAGVKPKVASWTKQAKAQLRRLRPASAS